MRSVRLALALGFVVAFAVPAFAEVAPSSITPGAFTRVDTASPVYGGAQGAYTINALGFLPQDSTVTHSITPEHARFHIGGTPYFWTSVDLPSGNLLDAALIAACDTSATGAMELWVFNCSDDPTAACTVLAAGTTGAAGTPGCGVFGLGLAHTMNQASGSYMLAVGLTATDAGTNFRSVRLIHRRQVSPGPAVATFTDVPTGHGFFKFVEALYAAGITAGCGGGNFCPDGPLTRGQMAVFLATALGLHWAP